MTVQFITPGYHTITPYLIVSGLPGTISFLETVFDAKTTVAPMLRPDGTIMHTELQVGDSRIMMAEENPQWGNTSPQKLGGSPVSFMIYVPDADAAFARALAAGCTQVRPVEDQFYGDRTGTLKDPFGFQWSIGTHIEEVSEAEGQKRMEAMFK